MAPLPRRSFLFGAAAFAVLLPWSADAAPKTRARAGFAGGLLGGLKG